MKQGENLRILDKNRTKLDNFQTGKYVYRFLPVERLLDGLRRIGVGRGNNG